MLNHCRAGLLNPDAQLEIELQQPNIGLVDLEIQPASSIEQLSIEMNKGTIDVVVLCETSELGGFELLTEIRKQKPDIPAILLVLPASGTWGRVVNDPRTELVSSPAHALELKHRIMRLLLQVQRNAQVAPIGQSLTRALPELRNSNSGKLDARLIASAFGLSEADLARGINKKPQTINATPDSEALQKLLHPFERIAAAIKYTTGSLQPALKIWLQAPNPTMPNTSPVDVIRKGHVAELANLWDDTMLGHPD